MANRRQCEKAPRTAHSVKTKRPLLRSHRNFQRLDIFCLSIAGWRTLDVIDCTPITTEKIMSREHKASGTLEKGSPNTTIDILKYGFDLT